MTRLCGIPSRTVGPCDLPYGHEGDEHANACDGFTAREYADEHRRRQCEVKPTPLDLASLADLRAEVERLTAELAAAQPAIATHGALRSMIDLLTATADTNAARNYVALTFTGMLAPYDRVEVTFIRPGGMTPHEAREKAEAEVERLRALVDHFPPGYLEEVASILRAGAVRHGCAPHESGGDQTLDDHLQHALDHLHIADNDLSRPGSERPAPDRDSGRSQFAHGGARCALGWACEREAAGVGKP